jgi:hypothetical protein
MQLQENAQNATQQKSKIALSIDRAIADPKNKAKFEPLPDNVVEQLRNIIAERDKK